jgi:hypothetical protein
VHECAVSVWCLCGISMVSVWCQYGVNVVSLLSSFLSGSCVCVRGCACVRLCLCEYVCVCACVQRDFGASKAVEI